MKWKGRKRSKNVYTLGNPTGPVPKIKPAKPFTSKDDLGGFGKKSILGMIKSRNANRK